VGSSLRDLKDYVPAAVTSVCLPLPLTVVDDVLDVLQMELVELQCNMELKSKFLVSSPLAFFRGHLSEHDFPLLVRHSKKIAAMFGSTY